VSDIPIIYFYETFPIIKKGYLYLNGFHVEKNEETALKYFKLAADAGNPDGQYNYGALVLLRYYQGEASANLNLVNFSFQKTT
jgi:hypothetical protein